MAKSLCSRRLSHTKCSFPLRTAAFSGVRMSVSSCRSLDKKGIYSCMIASWSAILEVEITAERQPVPGAPPPSFLYFSSMIQATRYAYVFPMPTPASQSAMRFPHKVSSISWLRRSCSSLTFNPCLGRSFWKI